MPDMEKVIKGLKACAGRPHDCVGKKCPYFDNDECRIVLEKDALELLKEQPEIVRCKDCVYLGKADKCILAKYLHEHPEKIWLLSLQSEWFCADGKRAENAR